MPRTSASAQERAAIRRALPGTRWCYIGDRHKAVIEAAIDIERLAPLLLRQ